MKFIAAVLLIVSFSAVADNHEENFAEAKAHALSMIDKRIEHMNSSKGCISAATDHAGIKKCREEMKASNMKLREMRKEMKSRRQNLRGEKRGKKSN